MFCPNCQLETTQKKLTNSTLSKDIIVDQCSRCLGIWCDRFELFQIPQSQVGKLEQVSINSSPKQNDQSITTHHCPRDNEILTKVSNSHRLLPTIFERCHLCEGIWLTLPEFTKIKKQVKSKYVSTHQSDLIEHRDNGGYRFAYSIGNHLCPDYMGYLPTPDSNPQFMLNSSEISLINAVPEHKRKEIYQTLANEFNQKIETENRFIEITNALITVITRLI